MYPACSGLGKLESHGRGHLKCTQPIPTGHIGVTCCLYSQCIQHVSGGYFGPCPQCHLLLEVGRLHVPIPVPPDHLPGMDEVPQIEVLKPITTDGLTLGSSTDFSEKRIGEITIPPTELVTIVVEGDGGGDCLTGEAGSTRRFGSLMTPRTRSGSTGRSLVVRRGDGGRFPMNHAEDVVYTGGRVIEGHSGIGVVGSVGGSG